MKSLNPWYLCRMPKTAQKNIRHFTLEELEEYFENVGEKKFRAKQAYEWIWQKGALSFADMTNLSKQLRQQLGENFTLPALAVDTTQHSEDGTVKTRFKTWDEHLVEGVLIPTESRFTACVSSQIGCSLSCKFCATGYMKRERNLEFDEIYDEVVIINQQCEKIYGKKLTNIVFMGMGEPLLNYKNVLKAIDRISSPDGLGMSPSVMRSCRSTILITSSRSLRPLTIFISKQKMKSVLNISCSTILMTA